MRKRRYIPIKLVGIIIILACSIGAQWQGNLIESKKLYSSGDSTGIKIGTQIWSATNLDVNTFRNGDPIQEVKSAEEWKKVSDEGKPAWCYYDIDPENGKKYGRMYNWFAINDPRKLAPKGWHVATEKEWETLTEFLGGKKAAAAKIKSTTGWIDTRGKEMNGTNESSYNALPGGLRMYYGTFLEKGRTTIWWTSSEITPGGASAVTRELSIANGFLKSGSYRHAMYYVRCLKE